MARLCLYGTVLNSADTVERSVRSVYRPDAEIVVVDGGSTDGTYEKLLEISKDYNLRVYRLPGSSRGLGRNYALYKCPEGSYAAYFDLDDEYNEYFHRSLEWGAAQGVPNPFKWLAQREYAIARGGWRDLNFSEDVEFWLRVGFSYCLPLPVRRPLRAGGPLRERRYARGVGGLLGRSFAVRVDDFRGAGYTLAEMLRAQLRRAGARAALSAPLLAAESLAAGLRGKYRVSRLLNNVELADLLSVARAVSPEVVGAPRRLASLTLVWTLALKVDLGSAASLFSSRVGAPAGVYRCANYRFALAASEEALALLPGARCEPLAP